MGRRQRVLKGSCKNVNENKLVCTHIFLPWTFVCTHILEDILIWKMNEEWKSSTWDTHTQQPSIYNFISESFQQEPRAKKQKSHTINIFNPLTKLASQQMKNESNHFSSCFASFKKKYTRIFSADHSLKRWVFLCTHLIFSLWDLFHLSCPCREAISTISPAKKKYTKSDIEKNCLKEVVSHVIYKYHHLPLPSPSQKKIYGHMSTVNIINLYNMKIFLAKLSSWKIFHLQF